MFVSEQIIEQPHFKYVYSSRRSRDIAVFGSNIYIYTRMLEWEMYSHLGRGLPGAWGVVRDCSVLGAWVSDGMVLVDRGMFVGREVSLGHEHATLDVCVCVECEQAVYSSTLQRSLD